MRTHARTHAHTHTHTCAHTHTHTHTHTITHSDVVRLEQPDLEQQRNELIVNINKIVKNGYETPTTTNSKSSLIPRSHEVRKVLTPYIAGAMNTACTVNLHCRVMYMLLISQ